MANFPSLVPGRAWELTSFSRRSGLPQAANEFLAALKEEIERTHSNRFTSEQAAGWMGRKGYSRSYTQKTLFRLKQRQMLSASQSPRLLRTGFFRGVLNIYEITKRGADRADWWLRRHDALGFMSLSGIGARNELARSMLLDALPSLFPGLGRFTLRFNDRRGVGFLLSNLSRDLSFSVSIPAFPGAVWWIERLKAEGTVPLHLARFPFASFAKKQGFSDEEILISVLYKSNRYWKDSCERLRREINVLQREINEEREAQSRQKEMMASLASLWKELFALERARFEEERGINRILAARLGLFI